MSFLPIAFKKTLSSSIKTFYFHANRAIPEGVDQQGTRARPVYGTGHSSFVQRADKDLNSLTA
jgi:hypothetical protein